MKIPSALQSVLQIDPEVMHGQLCIRGTRVPLAVLLDSLEDGMGVDEFVAEYPSVSREQFLAVVAWQQHEMREAVGLDIAS